MIKAIRAFYEASLEGLQRGMTIDEILNLPQNEQIARFKEVPNDKFPEVERQFMDGLKQTFARAGETAAAAAAPSSGDGRRS
jgi:DMSO/TMAO reductase YedYZ molybdopterin-dependent catalytic subunit